jgi:hypothetical protein
VAGKINKYKYIWAVLVLLLLIGMFAHSPFSQQPEVKPIKENEINPKLETVLQVLPKKYQVGLQAARSFARGKGINLVDDKVKVIIEPQGRRSVNIDRRALESLGGVVDATSKSLMRALIPIAKLEQVANTVSGIRFIRLLRVPEPDTAEQKEEIINEIIPQAVEAGISIYTCGYGTEYIDEPFLKLVAENGNGSYYYAPDKRKLREVYFELSQKTKGIGKTGELRGTVAQGEIKRERFLLKAKTLFLKIFLLWSGSDLDLNLSPSNTILCGLKTYSWD